LINEEEIESESEEKEEESESEEKEEESESEEKEEEIGFDANTLKIKIKSIVIKKDDSDNVLKSKIFQIIDFFDTYQYTFKFKTFKKETTSLNSRNYR
jgi:hypothetical protein